MGSMLNSFQKIANVKTATDKLKKLIKKDDGLQKTE